MPRPESGSTTLVSFLLGGLTGASLAVLLAPHSGQETRDRLRERSRDAARRGRALGAATAARGQTAATSLQGAVLAPLGGSLVPEPAVSTPPPGHEV